MHFNHCMLTLVFLRVFPIEHSIDALVKKLMSDVKLTSFFWRNGNGVDFSRSPIDGERLGYIQDFFNFQARFPSLF